MLCHINIHIYFSLITHHVWWIQTSYLPCGFWSCAIRSFYSEQRVFEQYSKTSLVSVVEGFVVFKGAVELLRDISAIFKNILKTKNIVIFFLNAEILIPRNILEVLKKSFEKARHDSVKFLELNPKSSKSRCVLSLAVNFWWRSSCLCLCSGRERERARDPEFQWKGAASMTKTSHHNDQSLHNISSLLVS